MKKWWLSQLQCVTHPKDHYPLIRIPNCEWSWLYQCWKTRFWRLGFLGCHGSTQLERQILKVNRVNIRPSWPINATKLGLNGSWPNLMVHGIMCTPLQNRHTWYMCRHVVQFLQHVQAHHIGRSICGCFLEARVSTWPT